MSATVTPRLLSLADAAEYLGVNERTLRDWAYRRQIPFVKAGPARKATVRFDIADLEQWIADHKIPAEAS